jgi:hypothetical protein
VAHLIDFLNRRCQLNPPKNPQNHHWLKIHLANLIRLAYWRRRGISANTIAFREREVLKKCSALCLFDKTSRINQAEASRTVVRSFKEKRQVQIATVPTEAQLLSSSGPP